jgi:hypothetical protein
MKLLHGIWTYSFKQKFKGIIKLFVTTHICAADMHWFETLCLMVL